MLTASLLTGFHISAIIAMVVFQTSQSAICRPEWFNAAVLSRLVRVNNIYLGCLITTFISGILQLLWGAHGILTGVYFLQKNWLLHTKYSFFFILTILSIKATLRLNQWRADFQQNGQLPDNQAINKYRHLVLIEAHILLLMPFLGAFLSHGFGYNA